MLAPSPPRPPLSFRVGITGTRDQRTAEAARPALAQILTLVKGEILGLADAEQAREVYCPESDNTIQPKFVFVSPLAEGADRVAADEALKLSYQLKAPLPFAPDEYESDFPDTVNEFRRLLLQADSVVLDGARGDYEERSYEAVGRFVVNNSDLLIAVWDGEPAKGRGGTGDIVELAVELGVRVVHVPIGEVGEFHLSETRLQLGGDIAEIEDMAVDLVVGVGEPRMIETWLQLRRPDPRSYPDVLRLLIRRTILPAPAPERWGFGLRMPALQKYWEERVPRPERRRVFSGIHDRIVRWLTNFGDWLQKSATFGEREILDPPLSLAPPEPGSGEEWWINSYKPADQLSSFYGDRYRSCYVIILFLAFCALTLAMLALASTYVILTLIELVFLFAILVLWLCDRLFRWHPRWISYRLLAELCRKQKVLASLGRSLPRWEVEDLGSEEASVGWYFSAMARAAPFPHEDLGGDALEQARQAGLAMLREQIGYHVGRGRRGKADVALQVLSYGLFGLTVISVLIELGLEYVWGADCRRILGVFAAILPTASAFFFGIRAYAEFELLADQSARMHSIMRDARDEIDGIPFDRPLASQDLGARIFRAAVLMMQDIRGWAQLFRVKHVETH
jgi:hypothetical protein